MLAPNPNSTNEYSSGEVPGVSVMNIIETPYCSSPPTQQSRFYDLPSLQFSPAVLSGPFIGFCAQRADANPSSLSRREVPTSNQSGHRNIGRRKLSKCADGGRQRFLYDL